MDRQIITVDIAPGSNVQQRLLVAQGDIGRPLGVRVIQNGAPLDCSDYTAFLYVLKPDYNYYECTCTVEDDSLVCWETAEQETPVAGECLAAIRIMDQDHDIGTATFVEYVEASPADLGYASESLVSSMTEFVDAAQRAEEEATRVVADVDNVNDVAVNSSGHIVLTKVLGSTVESDETVLQPGDIENDLLATVAGKVLDARQGKELKDLIGDAVFVDLAPAASRQSLADALEEVWSQIPSGKAFVGRLNNFGYCFIAGYKYPSGETGNCIISNYTGDIHLVTNSGGTFTSFKLGTTGNALVDCGDASITSADQIKALSPGMYRISGASTSIFPSAYGVLIIAKGGIYSSALFVPVNSTSHDVMYRRSWNNSNNTWYESAWVANVTTGSVARASGITDGTLDMNVCRKIGNVVTVSARLWGISATALGTFFVIPSGFRPTAETWANGYVNITGTNGGSKPAGLRISTDGTVYVGYSSSATLDQIFFTATYAI